MLTKDFDYDLPKELIAQRPAAERDASRLMVVDRGTAGVQHRVFRDLPSLLERGDLLVLNESKVNAARLRLAKSPGGGAVDALLFRRLGKGSWGALLKPGPRLKAGLTLADPASGRPVLRIAERMPEGGWRVDALVDDELTERGEPPLPPYIKRLPDDERIPADRERYQTVYARLPGSVAAPTAGLHFTPGLLEELAKRGVEVARIVLHVGLGTFQPVRAEVVEEHRMQSEAYLVEAEPMGAIRRARLEGRRIVAVGTSCVRVLETLAQRIETREGPQEGEADIFIAPGHKFMLTNALVTNFHAPRSTPYFLVCAFAGKELIQAAYGEAMRERYRFLSYGDAQFIR